MSARDSNIKRLGSVPLFDVLVVGGGINGAVSAAALSAKGAKVALIDRGDFAGLTSSNSSNLAWGGIKYLESYEFSLVNKLCKSRNQLLRSYPSSVKEIRFLTTIEKGFRFPPWLVFLGTVLYWSMGRFFTEPPCYMNAAALKKQEPVLNTRRAAGGFEYSDAYLYDNDARFVFNFIRSAVDHGCAAVNYMESYAVVREQDHWCVSARDTSSGDTLMIRAKVLINACGPYVDAHNQLSQQRTWHRHLFSKGIHLIIDRVTPHTRVLTFFASDGRLFFVIPMGNKTVVGTTDTQVSSPEVSVTDADRAFVLSNINDVLMLGQPITQADIIAERCGVRPLVQQGADQTANWHQLSRKHAIDVDIKDQHLSIFGGKTTDCINVGNEVVSWVQTLGVQLPYATFKWYGEEASSVRDAFYHQARLMNLDAYTAEGATERLTPRLWRRYGGRAWILLEAIRQDARQAECLISGTEFLRCEVEYAARYEMVVTLEDFLRRRSSISQVVRHATLVNAAGLDTVCQILFGRDAEAKRQAYIEAMAE